MTADQHSHLKRWSAQTRANADLLTNLPLNRVSDASEAGLWVVSLPWPAIEPRALSLSGQPTYALPLGQWPEAAEPAPRRLLMYADAAGKGAPQQLNISDSAGGKTPNHQPVASDRLLAECHDSGFSWQRHGLQITSADGQKNICLALGLRHDGETHWWEACRLVSVEKTDFCTTVHMSGAIARVHTDADYLASFPGYEMPLLHRHNWLTGHLYVRMFANGVCEVFARHINSKFADDGEHLPDVVPVVGFALNDADEAPAELLGTWDGSRKSFSLQGAKFDVSETARLATRRHPGNITHEDDMLVWQPYAGVELFGGVCPQARTGDPFIYKPEQRMFPRGMARTLRFSFSLSDRSPTIARYCAPSWWYGLNAELAAQPLLPAHDRYDERIAGAVKWVHDYSVQGGFEDGLIPRGANEKRKHATEDPQEPDRHEAGWEGDVGSGVFLHAYRNNGGVGEQLEEAIRGAYAFTDIAVDHAAKLVRMHGFPFDPPAFAQPMNRTLATTYGWLETGDPYLLQTAEAVIDMSYRVHQENWPRLAIGRDACFGRGAVLLYRYTGDRHYLRIGRDVAVAVTQAQRENGSFGDQGGGTGVHQWGGYITKPWMALLATSPVLDYLDLVPDAPQDQPIRQCIINLGNWLLSSRWQRNGYNGWSYQHDYNGQPRHYDFYHQTWQQLPGEAPWHQDNLGRLLGYCTWHTGDDTYIDAFTTSLEAVFDKVGGDHTVAATTHCLPWLQDRLWRATWTGKGVKVEPQRFASDLPRTAVIDTPTGQAEVQCDEAGKVHVQQAALAASGKA